MYRIFTKLNRLFFASGLLVLSTVSNATVVERKSLDELVADAPVVLIGTVMGVRYTQLEGTQRPYTAFSLVVQDVVAGFDKIGHKKGEKIELLFAGGLSEKGHYEMIVGMPEFKLGETYLLLLRGGEWSLNPVSGWHQGAFRLVALNNKGAKLVLSLDDAALVGLDGDGLKFVSPDFKKRNDPQQRVSQNQRQSGLTVGGEYKAPIGRTNDVLAMPTPEIPKVQLPEETASLYRENNVEALAAEDRKRPGATSAEASQVSREDSTIKALDGAKPILLDQFLAEIKIRHQKFSAGFEKVKFSLMPVPLPDTMQGQAAPVAQKPNH